MKIPKTPKEFDYDLWTTEDGKCMVRIKSTGEETEVDREVMKALRAEEKWLRRRMTGAPVPGDEEATTTILSLDYVSYEGSEDMSPAWLESPENIENEVLVQLIETELKRSLTAKQLSFYEECLMGGISVSEYARRHNIRADSAKDLKTAIQKKYKNIFLTDTPKTAK